MAHAITIGGRDITLEWTQESAKRFAYRLATIGRMPTQKQLSTVSTAGAAFAKIVWALLPKSEHARYDSPEDLFVAIDHEKEGIQLANAVASIFSEMNPAAEKKRSGRK